MRKSIFILLMCFNVKVFSQDNIASFKQMFSIAGGIVLSQPTPCVSILRGISYGGSNSNVALLTGYSLIHTKVASKKEQFHSIPLTIQQIISKTNKDDGVRLGLLTHIGLLYTFNKNHDTNIGGTSGVGIVAGKKKAMLMLKVKKEFISLKGQKNRFVETVECGLLFG